MNMECDNSKINMNCLREGLNFVSAEIGNLWAQDEEACARYCKDTEQCVAFTFVVSKHDCHLKYKRGGYYGPSKVAGSNSMNMVCDNSPVTNLDCVREGFNFGGAETRGLTVTDIEECVRHCRDTNGCVALTLIESTGYCSLKNNRGGHYGPSIRAGYKSMNMECDNGKVTNLDCLREDTNFEGGNLVNLVVADVEECARHCRATGGCISLTYVESTRTCYLKSMRGGYYLPKVATGYKSMNMECDNSKVDLSCVQKDGIYYSSGFALGDVYTDSLDACVRFCRDVRGCLAVSFNGNDYKCSLKSKEIGWWEIAYEKNNWTINLKC